MDYGKDFLTKGIITQDPPKITSAYPMLVPQVDADGNDLPGIRMPEISVPLATFLDGEPIRGKDGRIIAPTIQSQITTTGQTTGLTVDDANKLKTYLNVGVYAGFSLLAGMVENPGHDCIGVDNFALPAGRKGFLKRFEAMKAPFDIPVA